MEFKSIFIKAVFILFIILAILSILGNCFNKNLSDLDILITISVIPIFLINIIIIFNDIIKKIEKETQDKCQYYKQYENDFSIKDEAREMMIKKEIIYGNICYKKCLKMRRLLSSILVWIIVLIFIIFIFKLFFYNIFKNINLNVFSLLSIDLIILDICYKDKIVKKLIYIFYCKEEKNINLNEINKENN